MVTNLLAADPKAARAAPKADLRLGVCSACGLITNLDFDSTLIAYDETYEASLECSSNFVAYCEELCEELVKDFDLQGRQIVELGCGQGEFLVRLCRRARASGVGFDPSYAGPAVEGDVRFCPGAYQADGLRARLVCARHVLEHVPDPLALAKEAATILEGAGSGVYLEVPNAEFMVRRASVWDVIYEHCSYFTSISLAALVARAGLRARRVSASFGEQYLQVFAEVGKPAAGEPADVGGSDLVEAARQFGAGYSRIVEERRRLLADRLAQGPVALWGAGAKGIQLLNVVPGGERVHPIIDLNPRKQGRYVPGTAQLVCGPSGLREEHPRTVLVTNSLYLNEIRQVLAREGIEVELLVV
ncbi:MAG: class I SAM-dependent methyltransferase [Acidimicrobiales bacterium]